MEALSLIRIGTPEGVTFSLIAAGPVSRFLAWLIDFLCIAVLSSFLRKVLEVMAFLNADWAGALYYLLLFVVLVGYGIGLEWFWRGQTIGKRLMRLRVVDAHGLSLQFHQVLIRNLMRFIDMLPYFYLVGGIVCAVDGRHRRLGDMVADTVVIRNPVVKQPDLTRLTDNRFNTLRDFPHLAARLRQRLTPDEAAVGLQALVRRDRLTDEARTALFKEVADRYREVVPYPMEAVRSLSDEQYVRNVIEIVYTSSRADKRGERA